MAQRSEAYTAINPMQRVPALVLDDGTVIAESIAICRYFEALQPDPPLFGRGALDGRAGRNVEPARRASPAFPCRASVFQHLHPAMKQMISPQVPEWGEANKPRVMAFLQFLDGELKGRPYLAGARLYRRRYHRDGGGRFHAPGQARRAGGVDKPQTLARSGVGPPERGGVTERGQRVPCAHRARCIGHCADRSPCFKGGESCYQCGNDDIGHCRLRWP